MITAYKYLKDAKYTKERGKSFKTKSGKAKIRLGKMLTMRPVRLQKSFPRELVDTSLKIPWTMCTGSGGCGQQSFSEKVKDQGASEATFCSSISAVVNRYDLKGFPNNLFKVGCIYIHPDKQEVEGSSFRGKLLFSCTI